MIIDKLDRWSYYQRNVPELIEAFKFIQKVKKENLIPGKYRVGKNFAFVQEGITRSVDEADFEAHNKYLDIQILLEGEEVLEYADKENLIVKTQYNEKDDVEWLSGKGNAINITPGMFYLLYPYDAHKPSCHIVNETKYRKVVMKVKIDKLLHRVNVIMR